MPVLNPGLCKKKKPWRVKKNNIFVSLSPHPYLYLWNETVKMMKKIKIKIKIKSQEDKNTGLEIQSLRIIQNF